MKDRKMIVIICCIAAFLMLLLWAFLENTFLSVSEYTISSDTLPDSFSGMKILQLSDLHNCKFGKDNAALIQKIKQIAPDMIVITGDLVDSRKTDIPLALNLSRQLQAIAPTYYVPGNHESRLNNYSQVRIGLQQCGVTILENEYIQLFRGSDSLYLAGIDDPTFYTDYLLGDSAGTTNALLQKCNLSKNGYTILLAHRPEQYALYQAAGVDLVFSGHVHGGQFRLPFVGGLFAPNQGLFPKYDGGLYEENGTAMIISRGLGNSLLPLRFCNPPEIVVAELHKAS